MVQKRSNWVCADFGDGLKIQTGGRARCTLARTMCDEDNQQQQADEMCALQAIYGDDFVSAVDSASFSFAIPEAATQPHLVLRVHLPATYPSQHPPVFELSCDFLPEDVLNALAAELEGLFSPGEVVLYTWIQHLREQWDTLAPPPAPAPAADSASESALADEDAALAAELQAAELEEAGGGRGHQRQLGKELGAAGPRDDALEQALAEVVETVVHGEPFTEKRSTFQAHLAPATGMQHVEALMELLLQNSKLRAATHNIMAYRIQQAEKNTFLQDYDDDGETAAGGRLLHLLQMVDARNVCVVVSRWYGGILLGPARFTHINNAARELLDACGYITSSKESNKGGSGKAGKKR